MDSCVYSDLCSYAADWALPSELSTWEQVEFWRELLALTLFCTFQKENSQLKSVLVEKVRSLSLHVLKDRCQLIRACEYLTQALLQLEPTEVFPRQLERGAVPLEWEAHCSWMDVPHLLFHAELGLLWGIIGKRESQRNLVDASRNLAEWQMHSLDHTYLPFLGFFVQEADASPCRLLAYNYLLFRSQAQLFSKLEMGFLAEKQAEHLKRVLQKQRGSIDPLAVLLELLLSREMEEEKEVSSEFCSLPSVVFDKQLGVMGHRGKDSSCLFTLSGGRTGLGCFSAGELAIVNYGPQYLPLGDCWSFGIEGGAVSSPFPSSFTLDEDSSLFSLSGTVRVCAKQDFQTPIQQLQLDEMSQHWIRVRQEYVKGTVFLETEFVGLQPIDQLAFVFFLKGESCQIEGGKKISSRTLDRYRGTVAPVTLRSEGKQLSLRNLGYNGELELIPLSGEENFWGADFLLALHLDPSCYSYRWSWNCAHSN